MRRFFSLLFCSEKYIARVSEISAPHRRQPKAFCQCLVCKPPGIEATVRYGPIRNVGTLGMMLGPWSMTSKERVNDKQFGITNYSGCFAKRLR